MEESKLRYLRMSLRVEWTERRGKGRFFWYLEYPVITLTPVKAKAQLKRHNNTKAPEPHSDLPPSPEPSLSLI